MADLKPKRGFVYRENNFDPIAVWSTDIHGYRKGYMYPVLLIPDPDREPTPEEIEALSYHLYATTAPGALDGPFAEALREVARAAWRLGARVPS